MPGEASPLFYENTIIISSRDRCEILAKVLSRKLQARADWDTAAQNLGPDDRPLPPFEERIFNEHEDVREMEVLKAIGLLSLNKAPGPDGHTTEVYGGLPALVPELTKLLNLMYRTGTIPKTLRRVYVVPIPKAGKDPHNAESIRPITLISTIVKIMEMVIYHRILPTVEQKLSPEQYAYRRDRGTEMCLTELMDFVHREICRGKWCYLASFDIAGAFDNVPHNRLVDSLREMGVDVHSRRVIHNWLRTRTFQVRLTVAEGNIYSHQYPISKGLPQGGVLSPLLWLTFFNSILNRVRQERAEYPLEGTETKEILFADDLTLLISADTQEELREAAVLYVNSLKNALRKMALTLNDSKCKNIIFNPTVLRGGIYRRSTDGIKLSTRERLARQWRAAAPFSSEVMDFDPQQGGEPDGDPLGAPYPFPLSDSLRVLGVTIDEYFALDEHFQSVLAKAPVRQGILHKVVNSSWGLEVGVLKMTHDAVIVSLMRYALTVTGSAYPPDLMRKMTTRIANITSRQIGGLSRSARIEALHFSVGTHTFQNLYVMHCADFLDSCLRASDSTIRTRLLRELSGYYKVDTFEITDVRIALPQKELQKRYERQVFIQYCSRTVWSCSAYRKAPLDYPAGRINSVYVSNAPEIERSLLHSMDVYNYRDTYTWLDVALQYLGAIGWAPECSSPQQRNIEKILPPVWLESALSPVVTHSQAEQIRESLNLKQAYGKSLLARTGVAIIDNIGITVTIIILGGEIMHRNLYVHGTMITEEKPRYLEEIAVVHAFRTLHDWILATEKERPLISDITVSAGETGTVTTLARWMHRGSLGLESTAASLIIDDLCSIKEWARWHIILMPYGLPKEPSQPHGLPWTYREVLRVVEDFRSVALPILGTNWSRTLPRIPLTKEEIKILVNKRHQNDEMIALKLLRTLDSESAGVITGFDLTREKIQMSLASLQLRHAAQINLLRILCSTRYKYYKFGVLVPTERPNTYYGRKCGKEDSLSHMLHCYSLNKLIRTGPDIVDFLIIMAKRTAPPPPGLIKPMY